MKREDDTTGPKDSERKRKSKEITRERRRQSALERLGTNDPRCIFCGEADWRVLEKHHIAGQAYDDFTCIHCRNCHRKQSDRQKDHPGPTGAPLGLSEAVGRFLLGVADFFELLIEKLREFGNALIASVQGDPPASEVRP
jgi:hypothetical protein